MIEKLLQLLKIHFSGELSLKDGTVIVVDGDLAVGASVQVQSPDGMIPLPSGDYELESGEIISVEEGKITNVTDVVDTTETPDEEAIPVAVEEVADEPMIPEVEPEVEPVVVPNDEVEKLKSVVDELTKRLDELESKLNLRSEIETELRSELDFIKTKTLAVELKKSKVIEETPISRMDIIKNLKNNK